MRHFIVQKFSRRDLPLISCLVNFKQEMLFILTIALIKLTKLSKNLNRVAFKHKKCLSHVKT